MILHWLFLNRKWYFMTQSLVVWAISINVPPEQSVVTSFMLLCLTQMTNCCNQCLISKTYLPFDESYTRSPSPWGRAQP